MAFEASPFKRTLRPRASGPLWPIPHGTDGRAAHPMPGAPGCDAALMPHSLDLIRELAVAMP